MSILSELFANGQTPDVPGIESFLALLVAFVLGQFTAWGYMWSHRGVSYSRTFTQSLVLMSLLGALSMALVRMNIIAAFGLLGGLAIVRFRTVIRDSRDTVYILLALVCGMASGFGFFGMAALGALCANGVAIYLHRIEFGAWHTKDGLLRFQVEFAHISDNSLMTALKSFCSRVAIVTLDEVPRLSKEDPAQVQCAYNVRLRDPDKAPDLMARLKSEFHCDGVHLLAHRENEEVA